jgi:hypothetical protein
MNVNLCLTAKKRMRVCRYFAIYRRIARVLYERSFLKHARAMSAYALISGKFGGLGLNVAGQGATYIPVGPNGLRDGLMTKIRGQQFPISTKQSLAPDFMSEVMNRALYGGNDDNNSVGIEAVNPEPVPLFIAKSRENFQDTHDNGSLLFNTAVPPTSTMAYFTATIPMINAFQIQRAQADANLLQTMLTDAALDYLKVLTVTSAHAFRQKYKLIGNMIDEASVNTVATERLVSVVPPGFGMTDTHNIFTPVPQIEEQLYGIVKGGPMTLNTSDAPVLSNVVRIYCGSSRTLPFHSSLADEMIDALKDKDYEDIQESIKTQYRPVTWNDRLGVPEFGPKNRSTSAQDIIEEMPNLMYTAYHLGRVVQIGVTRRPTADSQTTQQMINQAHTSIDVYRQLPLVPMTPVTGSGGG